MLTFLGSIGLFLYGMKLMSESLQKIAGDRLRSVLAAMTRNRVSGLLSGFLVTALVQSSLSTTVMIVSFVNTGLISLAEAMAAIMGANVGTAVTSWLLATMGFEIDSSLWLLPVIALALPLFNSSHHQRNIWGEFIVGFALIFLSIDVLQYAAPSLQSDYPFLIDCLADSSAWGMWSVLLYFGVGTLLTILLQASHATFTLSIVICMMGWLPFELGCAMLLGSVLGTCLALLRASLSANAMARRAAVCHLLFNGAGLLLALLFFWPFSQFITWLSTLIGLNDPHTSTGVALGMALYLTVFRISNLILLFPFSSYLVALVHRLIRNDNDDPKAFHLQYLNKGLIASGELSLLQVKKETIRYANDVYHMFSLIKLMLNERLGSERQLEMYEQVRIMEEQSDDAEVEIANFLNQISRKGLSTGGEQMCRSLYKMVDELESIADSMYHMAATLRNKSDQRVFFSPAINANVAKMISLTDTSLSHMLHVIDNDEVSPNALNKAYNYEDEINNFRSQIRNEVLDPMDRAKLQYQQNTYYMELIGECERVGDYVINVLAAQSQY